MAEQRADNFGRAITTLGLEDKFLSDGELSKFPLTDRIAITNGIIDEKLTRGRWQSVIDMVFGGFGKVDMLYDGDKAHLRNAIVDSAVSHPKSDDLSGQTYTTLVKSGEDDLLFRLATGIPSWHYKYFADIMNDINPSYFKDPEKGAQRKKTANEIAAKKAMAERNYKAALVHFKSIGDKQGISQIFGIASEHLNYDTKEIALAAALADPEQKESRLKQIVMSFSSKQGGISPLEAYNLYKGYEVQLSKKELAQLKLKVAETASRYEIERRPDPDHNGRKPEVTDAELELLWAKKHAKDEPQAAYHIFAEQGYRGNSYISAVISGLKLDSSSDTGKAEAISPREVPEQDLRRAYRLAPFNVKIKIADHLKDKEALKQLSVQAAGKDSWWAYRLWVAGEGGFEGEYIDRLRQNLIETEVKKHGSVHLYDSDKPGIAKAFDFLMQTDAGRRHDNLESAYNLALRLGDEARAQRVRSSMVTEFSPTWALNIFEHHEPADKQGIDYVISQVAQAHGADESVLRQFVDKSYMPKK